MKLSERIAAVEKVAEETAPAPAGRSRKLSATSGPATGAVPKARSTAARRRRNSWDQSKRKVRELVLAEVAPKAGSLAADDLTAEVRSVLDRVVRGEDIEVSPIERRAFVDEVIQDILGYGPLDPLLRDETVTEIMCNAHDDIWVERSGRLQQTDVTFDDETQYRRVIEKIVAAVGRRIDEGSPMVDARLPDGSRVNAVYPPLAIRGPVLTVRKFAADPLQVQDLVNLGTLSLDLSLFLEACVRGRVNVVLSGGTGTGKTTMLNVLSAFVPPDERIITIEDAVELQLQQPHVVQLEARPANVEGAGAVAIRDLVRNALRMRPNRIIVGECRGAEALDMLQAMNTGHEGSMTTVHANTPRDGLRRLETMVLMAGYELPVRAIREQLTSAIDVIVQLRRLPDGRRVVSEVSEVQGLEGDTILLQEVFREQGGRVQATGLRPRLLDRLRDDGIEVPAKVFQPAPPPAPGSTTRRRMPNRSVPSVRSLAEPERAR